jgi:hypothetical protein
MPQTPATMNLSAIYRKTDAGLAEVKDRGLGLRAELRRLLILMDGVATLAKLSAFVRASEIEFLIAELELHGLITTGMSSLTTPSMLAKPMISIGAYRDGPVAETAASAPRTASESFVEPTIAQVQAVRRAAISTLHDVLGPGADDLAVKIERCKTSTEMRAAINEVRQVLDRQQGVEVGQRFIDAVRGAAESNR